MILNKKVLLPVATFAIALLLVIFGFVVNGEKSVTCEYENTKELSWELKTEYENKLKSLDATIKTFTGSKSDAFLYFIDKARYEQYSGNYCASVKTLDFTKKTYGKTSSLVFNNLGSVYDEVGDYAKAIEQYVYIIDNSLDADTPQYFRKITVDYINLKNYKKAREYYTKYEKAGGNRDMDLVNRIKKLK